jgi:hypothetical protein
LAALARPRCPACLAAVDELEHGHNTALAGHCREVERTLYDSARAERRYRAVDPDNRLVTRGLEADWEKTLAALSAAAGATPPDGSQRRRSGPRRPPLTRTASNSCTPSSTKSSSPSPPMTPGRRADLQIRWKDGAISELTVR